MCKNRITRRAFIKGTGLSLAALGAGVRYLPVQAEAAGEAVPFSSGTAGPKITVPLNATDCHHHIYDSRYPIDASSALRPDDATIADYRLLQKRLGTTRNIIVQPSTYGVDNSLLVDALQEFGLANTRGIAVVNDAVTEAELARLDRAGVRGIRFNLSQPGSANSLDMLLPLAARIQPLGWHVQVVAKADQIYEASSLWQQLPCPVVFDHLGHVMRVDHPAFAVIAGLLRQGKGWVKLSGAYILSKTGGPAYGDRREVARGFVEIAPEQLLWGSDWPHPTKKNDQKPDDAVLLDLLAEWAPDEAVRNRILVDNPARLYGF